MPTTASPSTVYDVANTLLACAAAELDVTGAGAPDRACVVAGGLAWDDCECGQLTVELISTYTASTFPSPEPATQQSFRTRKCGPAFLVAELYVTILRCVPTGDDNGNPPPCPDLAAAARIAAIDAHAVRKGVTCCLVAMATTRDTSGFPLVADWLVAEQPFLGPDGLCGGSRLRVLVGLNNGCLCDG